MFLSLRPAWHYRFLTFALLLASCLHSHAFVTETIGPVLETKGQSWWTPGLAALARHPSRVYARQSESAETLYFNASPVDQRALLQQFAEAHVRDPVVTLAAGPAEARTFGGERLPYTATLEIPEPVIASLLHPEQPWPEPRLTVYLYSEQPLDPADHPKGIYLSSALPAYAPLVENPPERKRYGVALANGDPSEAFQGRLWVHLQPQADGPHYAVGILNPGTAWQVWLKDEEQESIRKGKARLVAAREIEVEPGLALLSLRLEAPEAIK